MTVIIVENEHDDPSSNLDKAVCANNLAKGMNPILLPQDRSK